MTEHPNRQPKGIPAGGQFAASAHAEADVALTDLMDAHNAAHGYYDPPVGGDTSTEQRVLALDLGHTLTLADGVPETVVAHLRPEDGSTADGEYRVEHPDLTVFFPYGGPGVDARTREQAAGQAVDCVRRLDVLGAERAVADVTAESAYEANRAYANGVLEQHAAGDADGWDLAQAALAVESNLADAADEDAADARYWLANTRQAWVDGGHTPEQTTAMADALRDGLAAGDRTIRTYGGKTSAQWRAEAAASRQRSAESFERSDTDGYLSQWASDTMARQYEASATLAEHGGKWQFPALLDADGNLVPAKMIDTRYGRAFALLDPADPSGPFQGFVNLSTAQTQEKRDAYYAKKGYRFGHVEVPATVRMGGGIQPSPYFDRTDGGFDPAAKVVSVGDTD